MLRAFRVSGSGFRFVVAGFSNSQGAGVSGFRLAICMLIAKALAALLSDFLNHGVP